MRTKRIYNDLILQKSSKRLWLYVNLILTTSSLKKANKFINLKLSILCLKGQCHAYFNHIFTQFVLLRTQKSSVLVCLLLDEFESVCHLCTIILKDLTHRFKNQTLTY